LTKDKIRKIVPQNTLHFKIQTISRSLQYRLLECISQLNNLNLQAPGGGGSSRLWLRGSCDGVARDSWDIPVT